MLQHASCPAADWLVLLTPAQILAIKQAAAIRARAAASKAAKDMHRFMAGLDDEFGWSRSLKRPRSHLG